MKKILTILFAFGSLLVSAQDTTSLRWVGLNEDIEFNFFKTDTSDLTNYFVATTYGTGQAVFMNNKDSLLYAIFDLNSDGDRNLYSFNPFTGTYTLVRDLATTYVSSADISEDGSMLYVIEGNGVSGNIGKLSSVDLTTGVETLLTTALNVPLVSSYGIEFSPTDTSVYVFEGSYDGDTRVQAINLNTLVNTSSPMVGWNTQLHGAKWTGSGKKFIVTAGYGCDMLMTDNTANNLVSFYSTCPYNTADVEEFKMLRAKGSVINICPNTTDSTKISLIYGGTNFKWFLNGVALTETNDTLMAFAPGIYRALVEIDTTDNYMWSEPIQIVHSAVPVVTVTQATNDVLICPSETIILQGVSGGTLKWYRNGVLIPGAAASTYAATTAGAYNQTKTNLSGCIDSAAVSYVITDQLSGCTTNIGSQTFANLNMYPNPVESKLNIESAELVNVIIVYDIIGKEVFRTENVKKLNLSIDLTELASGSYFVKVFTASGETIRKIQK